MRRVWQQYREEGRDSPAYGNCGRKPTLDDAAGRLQLLEIARRRPDAFRHELAEEVEQKMGLRVTRQTIGRWLRRLGVTRGRHAKKKSVHASEQERADVKEQREQWTHRPADACEGDFSRVLFLDETGATTSLVRTCGRSVRRASVVSPRPRRGHWKTMTAVAAVRLSGLTASATMAHAMGGELFVTCVEQGLLPALQPGDVVVMDDLPGHRLPGVRELIESRKAKLLYLPPYSPDFNPIEMIWSKVTRLLRSAAARTVETPHIAFGQAMDAVTSSDILGCFQHCGHATTSGAPL